MVIHLPIGSLKTLSGLELVPRCELNTHSPLAPDIATAPSGPVCSTQCSIPGITKGVAFALMFVG